jgi:hypothetical protein
MWIGRQSGTWKVLAGTMYADHRALRDAKSGPSVPTASARAFVKQTRTFLTRKPDPKKRQQENKRAKEKIKLSKATKLNGNAVPKDLPPAKFAPNSISACAKVPKPVKFFKGWCTCKKAHCLKLYCHCRNAGFACNSVCKCQNHGCQNV